MRKKFALYEARNNGIQTEEANNDIIPLRRKGYRGEISEEVEKRSGRLSGDNGYGEWKTRSPFNAVIMVDNERKYGGYYSLNTFTLPRISPFLLFRMHHHLA